MNSPERERFGKVETDLETVESGIHGKLTVDQILDLAAAKERLLHVREELMGEAFDAATEKNAEIDENSRENETLGLIKDISRESLMELRKKIRKLSLDQNRGLIIKDDEQRLDAIVPGRDGQTSRLLDLIDRKASLNEEEVTEALELLEQLNYLKKEKVVASRLNNVPSNFLVKSELPGVEDIAFVRPEKNGELSINVILYYLNEDGQEKWTSCFFDNHGNLTLSDGLPNKLKSLDKEAIRKEVVECLFRFSIDKMMRVDVDSFVARGGGGGGEGGEGGPRGPKMPENVDEGRMEFYLDQRGLIKTITSKEGFTGYSAFLFKNGIILDNPRVNNAIFKLDFASPLTQSEVDKIFSEEYSDDDVEDILERNGFFEEIKKTRTELWEENPDNRLRHPDKNDREMKEKFYAKNGPLQTFIDRLSA